MQYKEVTSPDVYERLPHIDRQDIRYLWEADRWDGPLRGMLLYRGRKYWFENPEARWAELSGRDFDEYEYPRRFLVIQLTPEQLAQEERWHESFREHVGAQADYDELGQLQTESRHLRRRGHPEAFYGLYAARKPLSLVENEVVGWFEDSTALKGA